ncbi:MAG: thermonuclease family protein [Dehalococcoidia bacterium]
MSGPRGAGGRRRYVPDWRDTSRSRRRMSRVMLLVGALIFILGVGGLFARGDGADEPSLVQSDGAWTLDAPTEDLVTVTVDRIIDGDTLDVLSALTAFRVRLFGIDAPETNEPCYLEATQRLETLAGSSVQLLPDERLQDPNGRELRYVFTSDGRSIDATLVAEGLAEAWRQDGRFREDLVALEDEARADGVGCLWGGG